MKKPVSPLYWVILSAFLFSSCSSALKKRCEETDWFEYGESVAKRGQRTGADGFLLQCEKEEANIDHSAVSQGFQRGLNEYCTPDFAFRLGKQGDFLSNDMCSGAMEIRMKPKHAEGVREYCQSGNGESAGAAGKKYNQICPKDLESAFVPEFNKGRKKFLAALIARKESDVQDVDRDVNKLERRRFELRQDAERLRMNRARVQSWAPDATKNPEGAVATTNELRQLDADILSKQREIDRVEREMNQIEEKRKTLRQEIQQTQGEMATL